MEVVKDNNGFNVNCSHCKSPLIIFKKDLQYHYNIGHHSYFYVVCAACGERIEVDEESMPDSWDGYFRQVLQDEMGDDLD